jgi:hypothetical protein
MEPIHLVGNTCFFGGGKKQLIQWSNPAKNCREAVAGRAAERKDRTSSAAARKIFGKIIYDIQYFNMKYRPISGRGEFSWLKRG